MKVKLKNILGEYNGKLDDMVFYRERESDILLARRYTKPRYSSQNEIIGSSTKAIFALQPSFNYVLDLRIYLNWYKCIKDENKKNLRSWANVYLLLMHNMAKAYPEIDLRTLTREEIYTRNLPCISVKRAVEAGLLPEVHNWQEMDAEL